LISQSIQETCRVAFKSVSRVQFVRGNPDRYIRSVNSSISEKPN